VAIPPAAYADNNRGRRRLGPALVADHHHPDLIAISVATGAPPTPSGHHGGGKIAVASDLGVGNRANAQAQVSGDEIFVTTDSLNVSDTTAYGTGTGNTGKVIRIALATGSTTSSTDVAGGAGSVDVKDGAAYIASGKSTQTVTAGTAPGPRPERRPSSAAHPVDRRVAAHGVTMPSDCEPRSQTRPK
jgi:hypothetical protein